MRNVTPLQFEQTDEKTSYAEGVFQLLTDAPAPAGYKILDAFAVEIDPGTGPEPKYDDLTKRPVRLCCNADCQKCMKPTCAPDSAKAEPPTTGNTTTAMPFAVRETGWSFGEEQTIALSTLPSGTTPGPIFVQTAPPLIGPSEFEDIRAAVSTWLGGQTSRVIVHLYRLRDPAGIHALHNKIVGIPAERNPPLPG